MWTVWERTPPLGFATQQPHCECFGLKSHPTRNLKPNEEKNMEKWCCVIRLFVGQYTADTDNLKLGLAFLLFWIANNLWDH